MMGVKTTKIGNHGIKIWGNPNLQLHDNYKIKHYLKDHRVFMTSVIAALTLGGNWKIYISLDEMAFSIIFENYKKT